MVDPELDIRHLIFSDKEIKSIEKADSDLDDDESLLDKLEKVGRDIPYFFPPNISNEVILSRRMGDENINRLKQIAKETELGYSDIFEFATKIGHHRRKFIYDIEDDYNTAYKKAKQAIDSAIEGSAYENSKTEMVFFHIPSMLSPLLRDLQVDYYLRNFSQVNILWE